MRCILMHYQPTRLVMKDRSNDGSLSTLEIGLKIFALSDVWNTYVLYIRQIIGAKIFKEKILSICLTKGETSSTCFEPFQKPKVL